jgi:hypothetical protein
MEEENPSFHAFLEKFEKEIVEPLVAEIMKEQFSVPPPNLLVPEAMWKEDTKKQLMDICSAKDLRDRIISAQVVVLNDLKGLLPPADYQKFQENWKQGVEKLIAIAEQELPKEKKEEFPPSLQSLIGITEETIGHIYDVGVRRFQKMDFHKASDVFYLVTMIDYLRHNAWISLGLCEMENHHFELALEAFGMASITDIDDPLPYITSAECAYELGKEHDAKQFLNLARAAILHQPQEKREAFQTQVNQLQQKVR